MRLVSLNLLLVYAYFTAQASVKMSKVLAQPATKHGQLQKCRGRGESIAITAITQLLSVTYIYLRHIWITTLNTVSCPPKIWSKAWGQFH